MKLFSFTHTTTVFLGFIFTAFTGTIEDLLQKAENARNEFKDKDAIGCYQQVLLIDSNNFHALWQTSFLYQRMGWLEENPDVKKQFYARAIYYAKKLFAKFPETYEANIVMAGGLARQSEFLPAKEKVHAAWDIKKYGEKAMSLNPNDHQVWYLLGWLNFELSKANWVERSLASLLFGGLPVEVSVDKGIRYLEKANELKPDCIVYLYDLATFYEYKADTAAAIRLTKKALAIPPAAPEDFIYRKKLENLLFRLDS